MNAIFEIYEILLPDPISDPNDTAEAREEQLKEDMNSTFSVFDMPPVISGPDNKTYTQVGISEFSAEYADEFGVRVVIRNSDIKWSGKSGIAFNSYGCFTW